MQSSNVPDGARAHHWDIVILGGGMAGMSLAVRLATPMFKHLKILVVDPRFAEDRSDATVRDRTWCAWRTKATPWHPFADAVSASWREVLLTRSNTPADEIRCTLGSDGLSYEYIASNDFYENADRRLNSATHIRRLAGAGDSITDQAGENAPLSLRVLTNSEALTITCDLVFDSRPPSARRPDPQDWVQHFVGWMVNTSKPVFDPSYVTLMDFLPSASSSVHFMYVLPLSATQALVEDTWFSPAADTQTPLPDESRFQYESHIAEYLAKKNDVDPAEMKTLYREQGVIGMSPANTPPQGRMRIIPIGTRGGMVRASSGYAFAETQLGCDAIASELARQIAEEGNASATTRESTTSQWRGGIHIPAWKPQYLAWMDRLLLRALKDNQGLASDLFCKLFRDAPTPALIRFLSSHPTWRDTLQVVLACPKLPLLRAFANDLLRRQ
jgi:lycopene beta-cyclase